MIVRARYISSNEILCTLSANITSNLPTLSAVRVSNNGIDVSNASATLMVTDYIKIISLSPRMDFVVGGTPITIVFANKGLIDLSIVCFFNSSLSTSAYQLDRVTYICTSPPSSPGTVELAVMAGPSRIGTSSFHYFAIPTMTSVSPVPSIAGFSSTLKLSGDNMPSAISFQLRGIQGTLLNGSCLSSGTDSALCIFVPPAGVEGLFVDISVNDVSYIRSFVYIPVITQAQLVLLTEEVYNTGLDRIYFAVDSLSGLPLDCHFSNDRNNFITPVHLSNLTMGACQVPEMDVAAAVEVAVFQGTSNIFGPKSLIILSTPIIIDVGPLNIIVNDISIIYVQFQTNLIPSTFHCALYGNDEVIFSAVTINLNTVACIIHPFVVGDFLLTLISNGNILYSSFANVTITAPPNDLATNATAVVNYGTSSITITSKSCAIPASAICILDLNVSIIPILNDGCQMICDVYSEFSLDEISFRVCSTVNCQIALLTKMLLVLSPIAIASIHPSSGTVLGGAPVSLNGFGFLSGLQCRFGESLSDAHFISAALLICISPPSSAITNVSISLLHQNIEVGRFPFQFGYTQSIYITFITPEIVLAEGGTTLSVSLGNFDGNSQLQCAFDFAVSMAIVYNSSYIECSTPELRYGMVNFALMKDGGIVSDKRLLTSVERPEVLHFEPFVAVPLVPVNFSVVLAIPTTQLKVSCWVDETQIPIIFSGLQYICSSSGLEEGLHVVSLSIDGVFFYSTSIKTTSLLVRSISPVIGFSQSPALITFAFSLALDLGGGYLCCFGGQCNVPTFISLYFIKCFTPIINIAPNSDSISLPITVALTSGTNVVDTGIDFLFIAAPLIEDISPLSGPFSGSTRINISFMREFQFPLYFRIASSPASEMIGVTSRRLTFTTNMNVAASINYPTSNGSLCINLSPLQIACISRAMPIGEYPLDISLDNLNFLSTGFTFNSVPLLPKNDSINPSSISDEIIAPPYILYISPSNVPAGYKYSFRINGANFTSRSECRVDSTTAIETSFLSVSELICYFDPLIPGDHVVDVRNKGGAISNRFPFFAMSQPKINDFSGCYNPVTPSSGPLTGGTVITVSGSNLNDSGKFLYCVIDHNWSPAFAVSGSNLQCIVPPSIFSGTVDVQLGTADKELLSGSGLFEYIEDPIIFTVIPGIGAPGDLVQIRGVGFLRWSNLVCFFGGAGAFSVILSDSVLSCAVPRTIDGPVLITLQVNAQEFTRSAVEFLVRSHTALLSIFPVLGPAFRGMTRVTIKGSNFPSSVDVVCAFGTATTSALVLSSDTVICQAPPHALGVVDVSVMSDSVFLSQTLQYKYVPDPSVQRIQPTSGSILGGFNVFVRATNLLNVSSLACAFGNMPSRAVFLSNKTLVCIAPAISAADALNYSSVALEITINGVDYTNDQVQFVYFNASAAGEFSSDVVPLPSPNGTYCTEGSRNFSLCIPGMFQPQERQIGCIPCPVGFICPDFGMSQPRICPAGFVCDTYGLKYPRIYCPMGHYCGYGTKASNITTYLPNPQLPLDHFLGRRLSIDGPIGLSGRPLWELDNSTGVVTFNVKSVDFSLVPWPVPAMGSSRPDNPPIIEPLVAEGPIPCPSGHYCRSGVVTDSPIPKNFSTPQRCFDGYFCSRGSISPEGMGACPSGYFCPTTLDAVICPPGEFLMNIIECLDGTGYYCPNVGNTVPVECYPGTYMPEEGASNCLVCPTGHICPGYGRLLPEPCPPGF